MRHIRKIVSRALASVVRLVSELEQKVKVLEDSSTSQSQRLPDLEVSKRPSIHSMEVEQHNRIENEIQRRSILNDRDLRVDLEKQYGKTKWAKRLINEILTARIEPREI